MKDIKNIAFLVQARLNSERIPKKMIKPFNGTTLTDLILQKLTNSSIPNSQIYLAAHESELIKIAKKYPINIFKRSYESANVDNGIKVLFEWWNKLPYKYIVMVSACCPFLKTETIDRFIEAYIDNDLRGMFGVVAKRNYYWDEEGHPILRFKEAVMITKTADIIYEAGHCLYAGSMSDIGKGIWMGSFSKDDPKLFVVPEEETFDIDYDWQFKICESLYKQVQLEND